MLDGTKKTEEVKTCLDNWKIYYLINILEKYILALKKKCLIVFIIINIKNNIYNMVKIFN
jgi:hypothetical protein